MKILITGGSGFIGQSFINKFTHHDYLVIDGRSSKIPVGIEVNKFIQDISDDELDDLVFGVDAVMHLAAEKLHNDASNSTLYESNVTSTFRICNSILRSQKNIKLFFTSSLYAYGFDGQKRIRMEEDQAVENLTLYGTSKYISEHLIKTLLNQRVDFNIIRLFFAYGPLQLSSSGYKSVMRKSIELLEAGRAAQIYGTGSAVLDYIYIDDVLDFIEGTLTKHYQYRLVNLGSGFEYRIVDVIQKLCELSGKSNDYEYVDKDWTEGTYRVSDVRYLERVVGFKSKKSLDYGIKKMIEGS